MTSTPLPDAILVAIDFSPCSLRAFDIALGWSRPERELTLLHVIDTELAQGVERAGLASYTEAVAKMRSRAEEQLAELSQKRKAEKFETMVVEGAPFVEIVKIANDLDFDLVIMGSHGSETGLTQLLFGSTAEKVLRAVRKPVLCVP